MGKNYKQRGQGEGPPSFYEALPSALRSLRYEQTPDIPGARAFSVMCPKSSNWDEAPVRLMIVLQQIPSIDFTRAQSDDEKAPVKLALPGSAVRYAAMGMLGEAVKLKNRYPDSKKLYLAQMGVQIVNWNAAKVFELGINGERNYYEYFSQRVHKLIDESNPTHVLVCGDQAAAHLLGLDEQKDYVHERRGWVIKRKRRYWTHTLDLDSITVDKGEGAGGTTGEDAGQLADLLFYCTRHLSYCLNKKHPGSLLGVDVDPVYVDTIERFDKVMALYDTHELMALDMETRNLSSYSNAIYTVQLAFGPKKGMVIPVDHPMTPFTEKERIYVKKELRKRLRATTNLKTFIVQNGKFDTRVLRAVLNINVLHHRLWEITAGEVLLDENLGAINDPGVRGRYGQVRETDGVKVKKWSPEGLRAILCSYQNDWYRTAEFTKEDRNTTAFVNPGDEKLLRYAAMDVTSIWHIAQSQQILAAAQEIYDWKTNRYVSFLPYFRQHMLGHMSRQCLSISTMEQHGSNIDLPYMKSLMHKNSPLLKALANVNKEIKRLPIVQKVNKVLLKAKGVTTKKGLFGDVSAWVLNFGSPADKKALFITEMGLTPLDHSKKTGEPTIDKAFFNEYRGEYRAVELAANFQEITKLVSTYVKGWVKTLTANMDSKLDNRFRAAYRFFYVVTGRLASMNPNHQNIPNHGDQAKAIKRMFRAPMGCFQVRADYSAHEVRMWALSALDTVMLKSFMIGLRLRQKLIVAVDSDDVAAIKKDLKRKGDIHIVNVHRIFQVWVEKQHIFRHNIKSIFFGFLYGLSVNSMANSIRLNKLAAAEGELSKLRDARGKLK